MRYPLIVLIGLFWSGLFGQDTINQTDARGFKQGHWIYYGKDRPESGIASDVKVEEGRYIDGMKEGVWVKYQPDGKTPKIKAEYHLNRPVGSYSKGSNPQVGKYVDYAQHTTPDTLTYYVIKGSDHPNSGFPADGVIEEGYYKNDKREGQCIKYHNDGKTPKMISFYVNNRPSGKYQKYFESGQLKETGFFYKNVFRDSLKRFYENGQLEYEAFFDSIGKEQGRVNFYYESGKLEYTYIAVDGRPKNTIHLRENGDTIYSVAGYNEPSTVRNAQRQVTVSSNKKPPQVPATPITKGQPWLPNQYNKIYTEDQEIWQDGVFRDGQLWIGKVYVYDQDGILLQVEIYKNGVYHSDGQL